MPSYVVIRSDLIETLEEAKDYYAERLVGAHTISCHGREVTIVFERHATHLFSADSAGEQVRRDIPGGRTELRAFSLQRARLMDRVLPAITKFTVSTAGTGTTRGREKRMLHGQRLEDGRYLRVVLRPGPGSAHTCVSAYTVEERAWLEACRSKRSKFPP